MEIIFMNTGNSKTKEPNKYPLIFSKRTNLRNSIKYVALQSSSVYYTWKNMKKSIKQ